MVAHIHSVAEDDATGPLKEIYDADRAASGFVPNHTKALSLRPDVITAWRALSGAIRSHLGQRRYELITTVAAAKMRCVY